MSAHQALKDVSDLMPNASPLTALDGASDQQIRHSDTEATAAPAGLTQRRAARRVISVANNKGGTSKTTTTLNLAAALHSLGHRVLAIDLDAQCNLSLATGTRNSTAHVGTLLLGETTFDQTVVRTGTFDLLPSHRTLLTFESRINHEPDGAFFLKDILFGKPYDFILIDCPPSLGSLTINAMVASDQYIIPMQGENFAYIGLGEVLQFAGKIRRRFNPELELAGVLLAKYDLRPKFSQMVYNKLMGNESVPVFETMIRQDVSLMECTAHGKDIFTYAPRSRGAADFTKLCQELLAKV